MFASISKYHCESIQSDNVLFDIAEKTLTCYLLPRSQQVPPSVYSFPCTGIWPPRLPEIFDKYDGLEAEASSFDLTECISHLFVYRFFVQSGRCTEKHVAATVQEEHFQVHRGYTKFQNSVLGSFFSDFDPKA